MVSTPLTFKKTEGEAMAARLFPSRKAGATKDFVHRIAEILDGGFDFSGSAHRSS